MWNIRFRAFYIGKEIYILHVWKSLKLVWAIAFDLPMEWENLHETQLDFPQFDKRSSHFAIVARHEKYWQIWIADVISFPETLILLNLIQQLTRYIRWQIDSCALFICL